MSEGACYGDCAAGECVYCDEPPMLPEEDDAYVTMSGPLYSRLSVSFAGRFLAEVKDEDEAFALLARAMRDVQFWPNVWYVNDHGNTTLVEILDADTGAYRFTDTSYV